MESAIDLETGSLSNRRRSVQQLAEFSQRAETEKDDRKLSPIQTAQVELTNLEGHQTIEQQVAVQFPPQENHENDPSYPGVVYQKQLGSDDEVFIEIQGVLHPIPQSDDSLQSGLKSPNHMSDQLSEIPSENMHSRPRSASLVAIANAINSLSESRIANPGQPLQDQPMPILPEFVVFMRDVLEWREQKVQDLIAFS